MSNKEQEIHVGDFYESCNFHPCLCIEREDEWDSLMGISLVNGNVYSCSINSCGAWKMTPQEAMISRIKGPQLGPEQIEAYGNPHTDWEPEGQWWRHEGKDIWGSWVAPKEVCDAGK